MKILNIIFMQEEQKNGRRPRSRAKRNNEKATPDGRNSHLGGLIVWLATSSAGDVTDTVERNIQCF